MNLRCLATTIRERLAPIHPLDQATAERLATWTELLDKWSRVQRLVGWRSAELLLERGLADAWSVLPLLSDQDALPLLDVGSGAGLPGLLFAAFWPGRPVHLVEPRRKRASFLREAARQMDLPRVCVHHSSVQGLRSDNLRLAKTPLIFVARAFARPADVLLEAEQWSSMAVLISSSAAKLPRAPAPWPPLGWREQGRVEPAGERFHALLVPAARRG